MEVVMDSNYKPGQAYFVRGDTKRKRPRDVLAWTPEEVKAPDWIKRFEFFKSPNGSVDQAIVYKEYGVEINEYLQSRPGSTLTDIRRDIGVMVSVDGKEALTELGDRVRWARETQQRPVITEQGEVIEKSNRLPPKYIRTGSGAGYKKAYLATLGEVLAKHDVKLDARLEDMKWEGHHIKGLGNLDPFYKGATEAEKFELNQTLINNGYTAGETRGNFAWLSKEQHQAAHRKLGWGADEAMVDIDRSSTVPDYDPEAITSKQKGVSNISPEWQQKIADAPFNRPEWQDELLKKGVPPKNIDGIEITRANYLKEWLDLTDEAYVDVVNQAIRDNPIPGIDPELQIQANVRHSNPQLFEDFRAIGNLSESGWDMNGMMKSATGLSRAESMVRIMGGDYVGGALGLAMTTPQAQAQFAKAVGKLSGKQLFKMIPGVSLGSGALQALGYLKGGRWEKAGLSMLGGIIGEMGPLGDVGQAGIDLSLAAHDTLEGRGIIKQGKGKGKKPKITLNSEDDLVRLLNRVGQNVSIRPSAFL